MPRTSRPGAPFRAVKPRSLLALAVASLEASHTTTGVQNLLLAGVEGVAVGADLGADLAALLGAAGLERVATGAAHRGGHVVGVDVLLHDVPLGVNSRRVVPRWGT